MEGGGEGGGREEGGREGGREKRRGEVRGSCSRGRVIDIPQETVDFINGVL